jgi:LysM repeat protein
MKLLAALLLALSSWTLLNAQEWEEDEVGGEKAAPAAPAAPAEPPKSEPAAEEVSAPPAPPTENATVAPWAEGESSPAPAPAASQAAEAPATKPVNPPASEVSESSPGATYVVRKGDTLWDLANTYLKNPYDWTKIWEANKSAIANPDLIYPDQQVSLPSVAAAAAMKSANEEAAAAPSEASAPVEDAAPPATEAVEEASAPVEDNPVTPVEDPTADVAEAKEPAEGKVAEPEEPKPVAKKPWSPYQSGVGFRDESFLAESDWEGDGYIIRDQEKKLMLSMGDIVYLNVGTSAGIRARMRGSIYRLGRKVRDPITRAVIGTMVKHVGSIQITDQVGEGVCTAIIINSIEPIRVGDAIKISGK